jgi:hypothetical protein
MTHGSRVDVDPDMLMQRALVLAVLGCLPVPYLHHDVDPSCVPLPLNEP